MRRIASEADHQKVVVGYCRVKKIPIFAPMNENIWSGVIRAFVKPKSLADRIIFTIERKMKAMGKEKGIPDLILPVMRGGYGGLCIEMKSETGRLSKDQKAWKANLENNGYLYAVCRSSTDAIREIRKYLSKE